MAGHLTGPDLKAGVDLESLAENSPLLGNVDGEAVMLVRQGEKVFATAATCTHYGGPLPEGLVVGECGFACNDYCPQRSVVQFG